MFFRNQNQLNGFNNSMKKCRKVSRNLSLAYVFPFLRLKRARMNEINVIIGIYITNTKIIIQNTSIDFSPCQTWIWRFTQLPDKWELVILDVYDSSSAI